MPARKTEKEPFSEVSVVVRPLRSAPKIREEPERAFRRRAVLANVPSFRLKKRYRGTFECTLVPVFGTGGTSECTLVPVLGTGEHPPKPPFWKPPFCEPPKAWVIYSGA